jgi:hypothetical protein
MQGVCVPYARKHIIRAEKYDDDDESSGLPRGARTARAEGDARGRPKSHRAMIFQPDAFASHSYLRGQEIGRRCRIGFWRRMNTKTYGADRATGCAFKRIISLDCDAHVSAA